MPECSSPNLAPRLVLAFWSWRVIGWLGSPANWVPGAEGVGGGNSSGRVVVWRLTSIGEELKYSGTEPATRPGE